MTRIDLPEPPADLTLLLVHGIGQQVPGSVVDQVGNALLEWFDSRLEGSGNSVRIERSLLRPKERGDAGSARVTLLVCDCYGMPLRRLRLVESLWASEFDAPGFFEVLRWLLGPGSWLLFRHIVDVPIRWLDRWMPNRSDTTEWLTACFVGFVTFFVAVLPLQLVGVLLAIVRLLPIPYLRKQIAWLGVVVSEVLGDSYLFARNPVVRRALADRVHRDLDDLRLEGTPVAVLAHSQGAALALEMLERHPAPPPLATYGAGIRKLYELGQAGDVDFPVPAVFAAMWWLALGWLAAVIVASVNVAHAIGGDTAPDQVAGFAFVVLIAFYLTGFYFGGQAMFREKDVDASLAPRILRHLSRQPAWLDLFATHDPVPAGPLVRKPVDPATEQVIPNVTVDGYERNARTATLDSLEVVNAMSAASDHTSYWGNPDGFIDPLMRWLRRDFKQGWIPEPACSLPALCRRRPRTHLRRWVSLVLLVEVIVLWFRTIGSAKAFLPAADVASKIVADSLPSALSMAKPLIGSLVASGYGAFAALLLLGLDLAGLALYERAVLTPIWQSMAKHLATPRLKTWFQPLWKSIAFLLLFSVAAYSLLVACRTASYGPLVRIPVEAILGIHHFIFVGS